MLGVLLAIVIVVLLLLFVGIPFSVILSWAVAIICGLIGLALLLIAAFFLGTVCMMPRFHKAKGKFVRFSHSKQFDRAVYEAEGEEYACLFPAENVAREKIYNDVPHTILIHKGKKHRTAYDRHSLLIITVGTLFSLCSLIGAGVFVVRLLR